MNIYLVQVVDSYGPNKFLPLAVGYQWCYGKNENWSLKDVLIEKVNPEYYVQTMDNPDMVALSSYIWNWEYNQTLATLVKEKFPHCIIVTGGPQVPKNNPDFFDEFPMFDVAVHGEGELAFKEILARPLGDYDNIPHVHTRTHCPDPAQRLRSIADIPSPILEGFYDPIMAKYPSDTLWQVTWESLRGCPYHCAFCDIGDSYWSKITKFDLDRVKLEIDWMAQNKIEYVSVCDSNWGLLPRDVEITKYVIKKKKETGYPKWWDATWAKNNVERNYEIAMLNKEAGIDIFKGVTFAVQSMNKPTLIASDRFNLDDDKVEKYLALYKEQDIPTYSELIWPMPDETYSSLKQGIQHLIDLGQDDFLMIHPLVITFNSTMGDPEYQKRYGIETKTVPLDTYYLSTDDLDNYIVEYTEAVISTNTAPFEDVIRGNMFSWVLILMYYYGWGHYLARYMRHHGIKETDFFEEMLCWIQENKDTLLYREYLETLKYTSDTFTKGKFWGRKVLGEHDMLWEYKGASSVVLHNNINVLNNELVRFMDDVFPGHDSVSIVNLNLAMCRDRNKSYPYTINTSPEVANKMLGLNKEIITIDHHDKDLADDMWFNKAYHWQRKNRYWRCKAS